MMAALAATAIFTTSCSDDELTRGVAKTGTPINFSASTRSMSTRTAYGTALNGGKWDINWVEGDQVTVYCPEASTQVDGVTKDNSSDFTISSMESATDKTVYGVEGGQLYWGEADAHHFFEVYPSNRFEKMTAESGAEDIILSANLPSTQYPTLQPDGHYADMSAALMVGKTTVNRTSAPTPVVLPFTAITTAVDIEVSAAAETDYTIKSFTINNTSTDTEYTPLAGKFTYNTENGTFASEDGSEAYNLQVELPAPVKLIHGSGQSLKVTVFLRGDFKKSIEVSVHADVPNLKVPGQEVSVSVSKEGTDANLLAPLMRNHINLGPAPDPSTPGGTEGDPVIKPVSGEWWISHVPSNIYVSRMSLPGVYDACSFLDGQLVDDRAQNTLWTNSANMFYEQMTAYLNAGNRVFDMKPTCEKTAEGKYRWVVARGMQNGANFEPIDFAQMVQAADDWLKEHTTEFVVFIMSNYNWQTEKTLYAANLSGMLKEIIPERRLLTSFDADITVALARGKILIINATECASPIGISAPSWQLNNAVTWSYKNNGAAHCESDGVNDGYFGGVAGHTYDMGNGTIWVQDWNNVGNMGPNLDTKKGYVNTSIDMAGANTNPKNWYFTSITFRRAGNGKDGAYSANSSALRTSAKGKIRGLSTAEDYHSCGMIFQAYSAQEAGETSLESVIWHNNDPYFRQAANQ